MVTYDTYIPDGIELPGKYDSSLVEWREDDDGWHFNPYDGPLTHEPVTRAVCTVCGGDVFQVAQHDYETFIRCVKCRWEYCVHSG